ncbi:unnamed protein product, partial [Meganyctiphanes norvegica]
MKRLCLEQIRYWQQWKLCYGLYEQIISKHGTRQAAMNVSQCQVLQGVRREARPGMFGCLYHSITVGNTCDKVLVAIKGQKKRGILVGCHQTQKPLIPKFDSNNLVLIDDNGSPLGTRIHVPIPTMLRKKLVDMSRPKGADYTKILAIATRFV